MQHSWKLLGVVGLAAVVPDLETAYVAETSYRVTRESSLEMETVEFELERDGEPMEGRFGGGGRGSASQKTVVSVDRVLAADGGRPSEVERVFESVRGTVERFDQEVDLESPLDGVTLLLSTDDDGEVEVELAAGESVDDDAALEGHRPTLALDALLPGEDVEPGAVWDAEGEDLLHALGLDLAGALFAPPEFDFGDFGGGRGGGRRRLGGGTESLLTDADWDVTLTLEEGSEDVDGAECLVVSVEGSGSGSRETEGPGGRRRGFRSLPAAGARASAADTEFDIDLEGRLWFAIELRRPVRFEVAAYLTVESENEFERGGSTMRMRRVQEGALEQTVTVEPVEES